MAFDVKIILPNNLKSGFLKSEFIDNGNLYSTNAFSNDPNLDNNRNTLTFTFELRDKSTRQLVTLKRIQSLYISNDPEFDASSTFTISNIPQLPDEYDQALNYIYDFNPEYFFDNTQSQELARSTEAGTGLFKINNWPLSASGGLSTVYVKAIIEGPGGAIAEYPLGYGIFDQILWSGELPVNPDQPIYSAVKDGWTGKDSLFVFKSGADSSTQINNNGISRYIASVYEVSSSSGSLLAYSANDSIKRTLLANSTVGSTSCSTYRFYRTTGGTSNFSSSSLSLGSGVALTNSTYGKGAFFYSTTKLLSDVSNSDIYTQAAFNYSVSSIGITSQAFIKLYDQPATSAGSNEIALRLDIPNNQNPIAYLYTISNGTESVNKQITNLPNSVLPLLQSGGLMEMYYSKVDSSYAQVDAYFTPYTDQTFASRKSYLLGSALMPSFGTTTIGSAFGYQIEGGSGSTGSVVLDELFIAQGNSKQSVDIGDCDNRNQSFINNPVVSITGTWNDYLDDEFIELIDASYGQTVDRTISASKISISKIDSVDSFQVPACYEVQLFKPSLSNRCSVELSVLHKSDDFYVAFSPTSSYRPHTESGGTVNWDRPLGSRIDSDNAFSDNPVDAPTIVVKFSGEKQNVEILQRNTDNTYSKHLLRSYNPSSTSSTFLVELTDQSPNNIVGTSKRASYNASWIVVKQLTGVNINLIGYIELANKISSNNQGLGYYAAVGFRESSYIYPSSNGINEISSLKLRSLPNFYKNRFDNYESVKTFILSDEGFVNEKHYLGIKMLSGKTDFAGFNYSTPTSTETTITIQATTTGSNVSVGNISSLTLDGVSIANLVNDNYILIKDQNTNSENGVYKKTSGVWVKQSVAYNQPLHVISGDLYTNTLWYKKSFQDGSQIIDQYVSTIYFTKITCGEISSFISNIRPQLLEFKLNWLKYKEVFPLSDIKLRFFSNSNDAPLTPLTDWMSISYSPFTSGYLVAPGNTLVQVPLENNVTQSPLLSQATSVWLAISLPYNCSLAEAQGTEYTEASYIKTGTYSKNLLARNLWHKLFSRYNEKSENTNQNAVQQFRLRAHSHSDIVSFSTNLSPEVQVDITAPSYNNGKPQISSDYGLGLRSVQLTINAEDNDSGILAFRVGKEIDNYGMEYTPWMSWSQFTVSAVGKYYAYLYGGLNYYNSGIANTTLGYQNIGYSGQRKIWVQLMDYAGNVSESYPLSFVAKTFALVDTEAPSGSLSFYNPKTKNNVNITNLANAWVKINASDLVSGIKDFKIRRLNDSGASAWSEWESFSSYKMIDFTNENDGVKKVEFSFRDYGNNASQPDLIWEKVTRPNK